jgi:hypothetical protein
MGIDEYAARLQARNGFYDVSDLSAAGFSPSAIMEYEAAAARPAGSMTPVGDGSTVSPYAPQRRERHAAALAGLFGGEDYDRGDLRRAQSFTGTTDPSATFADSVGLADITPMAALYGFEEGADTAARGYRAGDYLTTGLGAGEMALGLLEAVPGVGALAKGAGRGLDSAFARQADRFVRDYTPTSPPSIPGEDELLFVPTPAEVDKLQAIGREVQSYPIVNAGGEALGRRPYAASTAAEYEALRPNFKLDDIELNYVNNMGGDYGSAGPRSIFVADNLSEADKVATIKHELNHVLGFETGLPLDEIGGNTNAFVGNASPERRAGLLEELRDRLLGARSLEEFSRANAAYRALSRTTPREMYFNNPGEILARAAEGSTLSNARLTPLQTLNPNINPEPSAFQRAANAIGTGIFSSRGFLRSFPGGAGAQMRQALPEIDTYVPVPSDYDRAMIPNLDRGYRGLLGLVAQGDGT